MTELLDRAVETAKTLPPEAQDDLARMMLFATGTDETVYRLSDEEKAAISESRAQAARGDFASEARMRAIWAKVGL